jgi:type IV pilus assembly protein PilA
MLARLRKLQEENEGGFTLIELLVVIIIIGILAAIAIPTFLNQRQKGFDTQAKSDLRNVAGIVESNFVDFSKYPSSIADSTAASTIDIGHYKKSPNVDLAVISMVNASGVVVTTDANNRSVGYCLTAKSESGKFFGYNSIKGGLNSGSYANAPAACVG